MAISERREAVVEYDCGPCFVAALEAAIVEHFRLERGEMEVKGKGRGAEDGGGGGKA